MTDPAQPLLERLAGRFDRSRGLAWTLVLLMTALCTWALLADLPTRSWRTPTAESSLLEGTYESFDLNGSELFLVIGGDDLFSPEGVATVRRVTSAVSELPFVEGVIDLDSIPSFSGGSFSPSLLPDAEAPAAEFEAARARILAHPLVAGQLVSADAKTLLVPVLLDLAEGETRDAVLGVEGVANRAASSSTVSVRVTGLLPLWLEIRKVFRSERVRFMVIGFLLVGVMSVLLFRNVRAVIVCALAPGLGVLWTFGVLQLIGEQRHEMTGIAMPIMLSMIGFTDSIHMMVHIRKERALGRSPRAASRSALACLGSPCFLTSITTAVGFGSLMIARTDYIQSFGRSCAIGVVLVFLAVVTVVPLASGTRLGERIHSAWKRDPVTLSLSALDPVIGFVLRRARAVTIAGVAATVALLIVSLQLEPEDQYSADIPDGSAAYDAFTHIDRELGGIQFVRVVVEWDGTPDEEILAAVEAAEVLLEKEPLFRGTLSPRDLLAVLPGPATSLSLLALVPEGIRSRFFNADEKRALVTARIQDVGAASYLPIFERVETELAALEREHTGFRFHLTGDPVYYGRGLRNITIDLVMSLGMASVIILILMWITYRSLRIGLISVLPNLFPLVVTGSLLFLLTGGKMEISSVCAFTICLGIAVDDTIHFLSRFRRELKKDGDVEAAVRRAFVGVGAALLTTTFVLVCGFATVLTSQIHNNRIFAAMGCSTIGAALIGDLLILPAMLKLLVRSPRR